MSYLEELLPEFRKGAKIRHKSWDKDFYIQMNLENCFIYTCDGEIFELSAMDICDSHWELYQEPVNWDHIIENKCLCWFYDEGELPVISKLVCFDSSSEYKFTDERNHDWENCHPVRRDEVTFYGDKKDV